ncbi:MAG TPA: hypothetical protein VIQ54_02285 [Polyangia bacterium]|jgi:hypothetical protein
MRWSRTALLLTTVVASALGSGGCDTVDLGNPPSDINACRPSQQFFIDEIWPNYLAKDYGGKHCYDSACHGALAPNALDLMDPMTAGTIPLTDVWAANYMSATEEMSCSNVSASKLLEYPAGIRVHGGGKLIEPDGPEAMLIIMWISQP